MLREGEGKGGKEEGGEGRNGKVGSTKMSRTLKEGWNQTEKERNRRGRHDD